MAKAAAALSGVRSVGRPRKEVAYTPLHRIREMIAMAKLDGRWGSWLGVERLAERITEDQWQTAIRFAALAEAKERALASPGCSPRAQDVSAAGGRSLAVESDATIARHRDAMQEWERIEAGLSDLQMRALDIIVVQQRAAEGFVQQRALRDALDKLGVLWKARRKR